VIEVSTIVDNRPFRVLGVYGEFAVVPAKWKICHFSTFASRKKTSRAGNSASLLAELKPMRERVKPRDISDMSALLQRDLNDARVAHELVPYLISNAAEIGFFPAILCALLPTGFLESSDDHDHVKLYPEPNQIDDKTTAFSDCWKLELFPNKDGALSALGQLWIDPSQTDIVVLDGQHRANAFRFVTDTFPEATKVESIYHAFYKNAKSGVDFDAELPVTVVWFQQVADEKVNPRIISRRLFVDVNTNAKAVNQSRNILLDDVVPSSVFASIFYTELAKHSFSAKKLSLLHGAFDCENDQSRSAVSLFSPIAVEYAFRLFVLGRDECDGLDYTVRRDRSKDHQNANRIARFFEVLSAELQQQIDIASVLQSLHSPMVRIGVAQTASAYAYRLLSEFNLFRLQIEATTELEAAVASNEWGNTTRRTVWEKVYCGGEGLFSSLRSEIGGDGVTQYVSGINEIEEKFKGFRLGKVAAENMQLQMVKDAYSVVSSIAGIAGLLMALSKFSESSGWEFELEGKKTTCVDQFISLLNKTTSDKWLVIFTEFKKGVVGGLEPKYWTHIRNIVLRVVENNSDGKYDFFKSNPKLSPDIRFVASSFDEALQSLKATKAQDYVPTSKEIENLRKHSLSKLEKCLERCGLLSIVPKDYPWPEGVASLEDLPIDVDADPDSNFVEDEAIDQDQI